MPVAESLKDLIDSRTVPFWKSVVEPKIAGKKILIDYQYPYSFNFQLEKPYYVWLMEHLFEEL